MIAVVEIGGNQFIVKKGDIIEVKKQNIEVGATMTLEALLVSDEAGKEVKIGSPLVAGSKIECKVLDQRKGEKVRVFKMKSKKRYMRNKGFRPSVTELEILSIA